MCLPQPRNDEGGEDSEGQGPQARLLAPWPLPRIPRRLAPRTGEWNPLQPRDEVRILGTIVRWNGPPRVEPPRTWQLWRNPVWLNLRRHTGVMPRDAPRNHLPAIVHVNVGRAAAGPRWWRPVGILDHLWRAQGRHPRGLQGDPLTRDLWRAIRQIIVQTQRGWMTHDVNLRGARVTGEGPRRAELRARLRRKLRHNLEERALGLGTRMPTRAATTAQVKEKRPLLSEVERAIVTSMVAIIRLKGAENAGVVQTPENGVCMQALRQLEGILREIRKLRRGMP